MTWRHIVESEVERGFSKVSAKVDRCTDQVMRKTHAFESQIKRDVIKALGLTYSESAGFRSKPFEIRTDYFSARIGLISQEDTCHLDALFEPSTLQVGTAAIQPLNIMLTQWGTVIAIKVWHNEPEFRIQLNWVKKTARSSSRVFLLDKLNREYYYPISTDLTGLVLPAHPRIGLIAFEPFRGPTESLELHFSDVKLTKERGIRASSSFTCIDTKMPDVIERMLRKPGLAEQVEEILQEQVEQVSANVKKEAQRVKRQHLGCLSTLAISLFFLFLMAAVIACIP